jgi:hypothetical protein
LTAPHDTAAERCTWCGREVEREDGFRVAEVPGERRAVFCRLEHVVPWTIQGARWEPGEIEEPPGILPATDRGEGSSRAACAKCGEPLSDVYVLLVRHRGEHRIPDAFCSAEHLAEWAKGGGRFGER